MSDFVLTLMAGRQYTLEASNLPPHTFRSGSAGTIIIPSGDFVVIKDEDGGTVFYHQKSASDGSKTVAVTIKDNDVGSHSVITVRTDSGRKYVTNLSGNSATFGSELTGGVVENHSSGHIVVPGNVSTVINHAGGWIIIHGNAEHIVNKSSGKVEVDGMVTGDIVNACSGTITVRGKRREVEVENQLINTVSGVRKEDFTFVLLLLLLVFLVISLFMARVFNRIHDKL